MDRFWHLVEKIPILKVKRRNLMRIERELSIEWKVKYDEINDKQKLKIEVNER